MGFPVIVLTCEFIFTLFFLIENEGFCSREILLTACGYCVVAAKFSLQKYS